MTGHVSAAEDLVLHAPRLLGSAPVQRVAAYYRLDAGEAEDHLLRFAVNGWVTHGRFADSSGWHLTDAGRREDERRLARELDLVGARETVRAAHAHFLPLNRKLGKACTDWQIRPTSHDAMAVNDHTDWGWDERVFQALDALGEQLPAVLDPVARLLQRFEGYAPRFSAALAKVNAAQPRWVDAPELDSCHTVWIQLHEDLLATLGIGRGTEG